MATQRCRHYRNSDPLTINYLIKQATTARAEQYLSYPQRHLFDRLCIRHMPARGDPDARASNSEDWPWSLVEGKGNLDTRLAPGGNGKMQSNLDVVRGIYSASRKEMSSAC